MAFAVSLYCVVYKGCCVLYLFRIKVIRAYQDPQIVIKQKNISQIEKFCLTLKMRNSAITKLDHKPKNYTNMRKLLLGDEAIA